MTNPSLPSSLASSMKKGGATQVAPPLLELGIRSNFRVRQRFEKNHISRSRLEGSFFQALCQ
jgi:hypothetical protein